MGMTHLATMEDIPPRAREFLRMAHDSGLALLNIINDILDLSKVESGTVVLDSKPFRLREGVEPMLKTLSLSARNKGLDFHHSIGPAVPDHLVGDQGRLRQVLTNLIGNAVKFTDTGSVSVDVDLDGRPSRPGAVRLLFRIKDSGIGIPKDRLEDIFTAFSQVGLSSHIKYGGTGLGLSISKNLVEMMDGRIWADSQAGAGSTFSFTVALGLAEETAEPARHSAAPASSQGKRNLAILLAEDNGVNRILAAALLEKRGHRVTAVENGAEALAALAAEPFDAVLMDVRMPDMDGEEATRRIRNGEVPGADPRIPIIALTAHALKGDRERFLAAGMDDYVAKPIDDKELLRVLAAVSR
jgi:CheY-like chemotaxis protein